MRAIIFLEEQVAIINEVFFKKNTDLKIRQLDESFTFCLKTNKFHQLRISYDNFKTKSNDSSQ